MLSAVCGIIWYTCFGSFLYYCLQWQAAVIPRDTLLQTQAYLCNFVMKLQMYTNIKKLRMKILKSWIFWMRGILPFGNESAVCHRWHRNAIGWEHSHCHSLSVTQSCAVTVTVRVPFYYMCYLAILTLNLLTWKIWWAPSNASNSNVYYLVTYVWQHWQPSLFTFCTMPQHWINCERHPVLYLCVNT